MMFLVVGIGFRFLRWVCGLLLRMMLGLSRFFGLNRCLILCIRLVVFLFYLSLMKGVMLWLVLCLVFSELLYLLMIRW